MEVFDVANRELVRVLLPNVFLSSICKRFPYIIVIFGTNFEIFDVILGSLILGLCFLHSSIFTQVRLVPKQYNYRFLFFIV